MSDMRALGAPEQQTTSWEWQAATNLLLTQTDALGRRTTYTPMTPTATSSPGTPPNLFKRATAAE